MKRRRIYLYVCLSCSGLLIVLFGLAYVTTMPVC